MNTPRIALDQWQALVAVVDAGSYARAAEVLHKTQSTVTYAVQKIESLLAVKAFDIQGRKAVLTPVGQTLYRRARLLLEEAGGLESVMGGTTEALLRGETDIAVAASVPSGFLGEALLRMRMLAVAHPENPLHKLARPLTYDDLRKHHHLLVRESGTVRGTRPIIEASQRWTVSHMATSIEAVRAGYGYAWLAEEKIRDELESNALKPLPLREGVDRYAELYLVFANRELAGPGVLRLGEIIREVAKEACPAARLPARSTRARKRAK
jgi:DNA-binding transcriptional LysR family regulator